MEWVDNGILVRLSPFGERKSVATFFTENHGLHKGMVIHRKDRPTLHPGSCEKLRWKARLRDHLGQWETEPMPGASWGHFFHDPLALMVLGSSCAMIEMACPDEQPDPILYEALWTTINHLAKDTMTYLKTYVMFEVLLLKQSGFGLDLQFCAVTGDLDNLVYVSPRTGRAVSRMGGEPYKDRLLPLPSFILNLSENTDFDDIYNGLYLTQYFFDKFIFAHKHKPLPSIRHRLLTSVMKTRNNRAWKHA